MSNNITKRKKLVKLFKTVDQSGLTAGEYFKRNNAFISLPQYYRLRKRFDEEGIKGLEDRRSAGNSRKVNPDQVELIRSVFTYNRKFTSKEPEVELREKWDIQLHKTRIDQYRREFGLTRIKSAGEDVGSVQFAGIEIFSAIAHHIGILDHWHIVIEKRLKRIKQSLSYQNGANVKPLWSSKRCRKSKAAMLGRVMGCLEQVIIHM